MPQSETPPASRTIGFGQFIRGALKTLPDTGNTLRGLGTLLRVRFGATLSIGRVLETRAGKSPQAPALLADERRWTYAEFNAWANRIANVFAQRGVQRGDCVALLMENHPSALACVAALSKLGAVAGMLNPNLRGDALRHSVRAMNPGHLVMAGECLPGWEDLQPQWSGTAPFWLRGYGDAALPDGWADLDALCAQASDENPASTATVEPADPCYYILTSGTTGMPKASVMTHRRWLRAMGGMGQLALRLHAGDILYCALPLYHNNALTVSWSAAMGAGAALALDRKFSASRFWDRVRHYDATAFTYIGELCRYLLAQPPSPRDREHRVHSVIGNGLRPEVWQAFKQRFGVERVCEFYGASEGNLVFINGFNLDETAGYCPFSYAVVDCDPATAQPKRGADGKLIEVGKGGVGLLLTEVTNRFPFDGYTDADSTESKLIRNGFKSGDCWLNTGDLVRDQGFSHIAFVDRLGDTFRWKGENVATTEVEAALMCAPGVADCAAYGVLVPQADGRAGMAAVRLDDGARLDGEAVAAHLHQRLPAYAVPVFLRQVPDLETTATFKTRKHDLREQGADPARVADPLYVLAADGSRYEPLDTATWAAIDRGDRRL